MAKAYNPAEYETVKERKARFYTDHEDGRIEVEIRNDDIMDHAFYISRVYIDRADQLERLPRGTGTALEIRDMELSVSNQGKQYESVNYTSWSENAEESAVGRALDNAGYSGNRRCSREEMEKVGRHAEVLGNKPPGASPYSPAGKDEHWCEIHKTSFFQRGKMQSFAHPTGEGSPWCYERSVVAKPAKAADSIARGQAWNKAQAEKIAKPDENPQAMKRCEICTLEVGESELVEQNGFMKCPKCIKEEL